VIIATLFQEQQFVKEKTCLALLLLRSLDSDSFKNKDMVL